MEAESVLEFWFSDPVRPFWFRSTPALDQEIRERFHALWQQARDGRLADFVPAPALEALGARVVRLTLSGG